MTFDKEALLEATQYALVKDRLRLHMAMQALELIATFDDEEAAQTAGRALKALAQDEPGSDQ
jgi:hypothetical protein